MRRNKSIWHDYLHINPKDSTKQLLEIISEFSRVTGYKENIQKLLVYKNTIDFYVLYPVTWLNLLVTSMTFWCRFLGIFCVNSHVICKWGVFSFFLSDQ